MNLLETDNNIIFRPINHYATSIELHNEVFEKSRYGGKSSKIVAPFQKKENYTGTEEDCRMMYLLNFEKELQPAESFYNYQEIRTFDESVSLSNRENILKCFLLVQRAAAYDKENNAMDLYESYNKYLKELGWFFNAYVLHTLDFKKKIFDVNEILFELLASFFPNTSVQNVLKQTIKALQKLSSNKEALAAFIKTCMRLNCFQIGMASQDKNIININSIVFRFIKTEKRTKILFFDLPFENVEFQYGFFSAEISENNLQQAADAARKKLGDVKRYISNIQLAE